MSFIVAEQEKETETFLDYVRIVDGFSKIPLLSPQRWKLAELIATKRYTENLNDAIASANAEKLGLVIDSTLWRRRFRANLICDLADGTRFLEEDSLSHELMDFSDAVVSGAWPIPSTTGPFVALSAHWGSGVGALRHLQQSVGSCSLFVGHDSNETPTYAMHIAAMRRLNMIEKLTKLPPTGIVAFASDFDRLIENSVVPVIHFDIASRSSQKKIQKSIEGLVLEFPSGALWHIAKRKLPVVFYSAFREPRLGTLHIRIEAPFLASSFDELAANSACFLRKLVVEYPYFWHSWATPSLFPELK